jgi:hypothetical protein
MLFLLILSTTYVVYVRDLGKRGWPRFAGVPGFEAASPFGEIRAFATYRTAHAWRIATVQEALTLPDPARTLGLV